MIFEDVCHIGSVGKQYPLYNRGEKKGCPLSFLTLSIYLSLFFPLVLCVYFLSLSPFLPQRHAHSHMIYCRALNAVMPYVLWSVEYCSPV